MSTATELEIVTETDVPYVDDRGEIITADVYRPSDGGPWPVVVMLHGEPSDLSADRLWGESIARAGAVVLSPSWATESVSRRDQIRTHFVSEIGNASCAVAWARERAASYGGDPSDVTVFGHCTGANVAAMTAFGESAPVNGCLAEEGSSAPDALVLFEGDWLLEDPSWDQALDADSGVMRDFTPWADLAPASFPVRLLVSELAPNELQRLVADLWAADTWLADRDRGGALRRRIERLGLLDDGSVGIDDESRLLLHRLESLGVDVSLRLLAGSGHTSLSQEGMRTLLEATLG